MHTYIRTWNTQQRARRVLAFPSFDADGNMLEEPTQTQPPQLETIITPLSNSNNNKSSSVAGTDVDVDGGVDVDDGVDVDADGLTVNVPHWFEPGTLSNLEVRVSCDDKFAS